MSKQAAEIASRDIIKRVYDQLGTLSENEQRVFLNAVDKALLKRSIRLSMTQILRKRMKG